MITQTEALDIRQYVAQYELLRAQVIGTPRDMAGREASQRRGIGLALLLREGMPGWLKAMEAVLRASLAAPPSEVSGSGVRTALEGRPADAAVPIRSAHAQHHDITILLASLVLSTRHLPGLSPSEGGYRPCQ
jgi:hypothetical protein